MATGIIRILVGSAVAALALAAAALAVEGYNAAAPQSRDTTVRLQPQDPTGSYNVAALKAMGARYEAMADYYRVQSRSTTAGRQHRREQAPQQHRECLGPPYWAPTPVAC
jgi:ABC-type sugar transport system substrate-binding protein